MKKNILVLLCTCFLSASAFCESNVITDSTRLADALHSVTKKGDSVQFKPDRNNVHQMMDVLYELQDDIHPVVLTNDENLSSAVELADSYGDLNRFDVTVTFTYEGKQAIIYKVYRISVSSPFTSDQYAEIWRNARDGQGEFTNYELEEQTDRNEAAGLGAVTDSAAEAQRTANAAAGYGKVTDVQLEKQRAANLEKGLGSYSDEELKNTELLASLTKAKEQKQKFINEKQYFYLLAFYYDNDRESYKTLSERIKNGIPGPDEYDVFETYDVWVELYRNYEKYFTEYPPFEIETSQLEQKNVDYTNRTVDYGFTYTLNLSKKYQDLSKVIFSGLDKVSNSDWKEFGSAEISNGIGMVRKVFTNSAAYSWDKFSVEDFSLDSLPSFAKLEEQYKSLDVSRYSSSVSSLVSKNKVNVENLKKEIDEYYEKNGIALFCYATAKNLGKAPAGLYAWNMTTSGIEYWNSASSSTCYEARFSIYDENGTLLVQGPKRFLKSYFTWGRNSDNASYTDVARYVFPKVGSDVMKKISKGEYKLRLDGLWLDYGLVDGLYTFWNQDLSYDKLRSVLKSISIPSENVMFSIKDSSAD